MAPWRPLEARSRPETASRVSIRSGPSPNHQTEILRGASHHIQEDAPDEILAAISAWSPGG